MLEASSRLGGRTHTVEQDGFIIDTGASAMANSYRAYHDLAEELNLNTHIVNTSNIVTIPKAGKLHALDTQKMINTGIFTQLFSPIAKARMAKLMADVQIAKFRGLLDYNNMSTAAPIDTESAREYSLRNLGEELTEYLCEPLVRIMLIANADQVSKVELFSAIANIFGTRVQALQGGVGAFATRLASTLDDIQTNSTVTTVNKTANGVTITYKDFAGETVSTDADACVIACPLPQARNICTDYGAILEKLDAKINYTQTITVALGFSALPNTQAFVIPIPKVESKNIALLFMDHNKSPDRAPEKHALINVHWENLASQQHMDKSDDWLVENSLAYIDTLFPELRGKLVSKHLARWTHALPLTSTGVYKAIQEFSGQLDANDRVQFAADYMSAAGQNTAVAYGKAAAENLLNVF